MCFMCLRDNPFSSVDETSSVRRKRARMLEIKKVLSDVEKHASCDIGEETISKLRDEQYRLSREL